jgi:site-specific recombinase XerC
MFQPVTPEALLDSHRLNIHVIRHSYESPIFQASRRATGKKLCLGHPKKINSLAHR